MQSLLSLAIMKNKQKQETEHTHVFHITKSTQCNNRDQSGPSMVTTVVKFLTLAIWTQVVLSEYMYDTVRGEGLCNVLLCHHFLLLYENNEHPNSSAFVTIQKQWHKGVRWN